MFVVVGAAAVVAVPFDLFDAIDLLSSDFERRPIYLLLFSSVILTEAHRFVDRPNAIQLAVDAMPHVASVNEHLVVVTIDFGTESEWKAEKIKLNSNVWCKNEFSIKLINKQKLKILCT